MTPHRSHAVRAFTLIETLMAVALLSMTTLLAVPMYREAAARSYRLLVIEQLRETAWDLAWHTHAVTGNAGDDETAKTGPYKHDGDKPAHGQRSAGKGTGTGLLGIYRIAITRDEDGMPYIRATPIAGGAMHQDACATYELGINGNRRNIDAAGRRLPFDKQQACWHGRG